MKHDCARYGSAGHRRSREKKTSVIGIRLTDEQRAMIDKAACIGPYRISITEIVNRGVQLALAELETLASKGGEA